MIDFHQLSFFIFLAFTTLVAFLLFLPLALYLMPQTTRPNVSADAPQEVEAMGVADSRGSSIEIHIVGKPPSQPRTQATKVGSRIFVYNPAARTKRIYSQKIREELHAADLVVKKQPAQPALTVPWAPFLGPISAMFLFGVKNMNKDLDNMLKFILDVLEDAGVYQNDRLVQKIIAEKIQSDNEYTSISLSLDDTTVQQANQQMRAHGDTDRPINKPAHTTTQQTHHMHMRKPKRRTPKQTKYKHK